VMGNWLTVSTEAVTPANAGAAAFVFSVGRALFSRAIEQYLMFHQSRETEASNVTQR
jgi:hypothetical protein